MLWDLAAVLFAVSGIGVLLVFLNWVSPPDDDDERDLEPWVW